MSEEKAKGSTAVVLSTVAGSVDVVGLGEIGRYDSHMTGTTTHAMLRLVAGDERLVLFGLIAIACFLAGATLAGAIIGPRGHSAWSRTAAILIAIEAILIAVGGVFIVAFAPTHDSGMLVVGAFAMAMGVQNTATTRLMSPFQRTTHVTSNLTDVGGTIGTILRRGRRRIGGEDGNDKRDLAGPGLPIVGFAVGGLVGAIAVMVIERWSGLAAAGLPVLLTLWLAMRRGDAAVGG